MQIDLRKHRKLYHALYSDVFQADDLVLKLFKRSGDPSLDSRAATLFEAVNHILGRTSQHSSASTSSQRFSMKPATISAPDMS